MKRILLGLGLCAMGAASTSFAADDTGAWYVSPMVQWTMLHHERPAEDDAGFQIGLGKNFAPNWAAEFNFSSGSFDGVNRSRLKLSQYSVDLIRKFGYLPDSKIQPYLLAGVGGIDDKLTNSARTSTFAGEVGAGLLWNFGHQEGPNRLQLRTEAKYRKELATTPYGASDPGDTIFGVGLQYLFGAPVAAAPVVAALPPPPPPPPAPVAAPVVLPPADSDGDGVPDSADQCPDTPRGVKVGPMGCPCELTQEVHFANASATLTAQDKVLLDKMILELKRLHFVNGEIQGHTDANGSNAYNQKLSERRAQAVADYVKANGISEGRFTVIGYGEEKPAADNASAEGRAHNRRVVLQRTDCK